MESFSVQNEKGDLHFRREGSRLKGKAECAHLQAVVCRAFPLISVSVLVQEDLRKSQCAAQQRVVSRTL